MPNPLSEANEAVQSSERFVRSRLEGRAVAGGARQTLTNHCARVCGCAVLLICYSSHVRVPYVPSRVCPILVLLLIALGCTPNMSIPTQARIGCATNADCPSGFVCNQALARCFPRGSDDVQPPSAAKVEVMPLRVGGGRTLRVSIVPSEPLAQPPAVSILDGARSLAMQADGQDGDAYVFTYTPDRSETQQQPLQIVAAMLDQVGNRTEDLAIGTVIFDFVPPQVAYANVVYTPAADNPLDAVRKARADTTITVVLSPNEPLDPSAALSLEAVTGEATLAFERVSAEAGTVVFQAVPGELADGVYTPRLSWTDVAGNRTSEATFSPSIAVKTSVPDLQVAQNRVTYVRAPLGSGAGTAFGEFAWPSEAYAALAPGDPDAASSSLAPETFSLSQGNLVRLRLYSDAGRDHRVAEMRSNAAGRWPRLVLPNPQVAGLYATGVDSAGNETAPVAIQNNLWLASPHVPEGRTTPHRLALIRQTRAQLLPGERHQLAYVPGGEAADTQSALARSPPVGWRVRSPRAHLGERSEHTLVADTRLGRLLLFGGKADADSGAAMRNDLWAWTESGWKNITPSLGQLPAVRAGHGAAYDALRGRMVVFGGEGDGGLLRDTWEWDGAHWRRIATTTAPSPRRTPLTYHEGLEAAVLFSGDASKSDLWTYDGAEWRDITPSVGPLPPGRIGHGIAYDPLRDRLVVFGGEAADGTPLNDLWEWDGSRWYEVGSGPDGADRTHLCMSWDGEAERVLVYGGVDDGDGRVWGWNGSDWQYGKSFKFQQRSYCAMAWDPTRGAVALHGGVGDFNPIHPLEDPREVDKRTKRFDVGSGMDWVEHTAAGVWPREEAALGLSGGVSGVRFLGGPLGFEHWVWTGTSWQIRTTPCMSDTPKPPERLLPAAASRQGLPWFFGGARFDPDQPYSFGPRYSDLWQWWPRADQCWQTFDSDNIDPWPTARRGAAMAWDAAGSRLVLFGGDAGGQQGATREVWTAQRDGLFQIDWTNTTPSSGLQPPPSSNHSMAFDARREVWVVMGGSLDGVWEWDGSAWSRPTPSAGQTPDVPGQRPQIYWDPEREAVMLISPTDGLWRWDGERWQHLPINGAQPPISGSYGYTPFGFDAQRRVAVAWDGASVTEIDASFDRQPGVTFIASFAEAGISRQAVRTLAIRARCGGRATSYEGSSDGASLHLWTPLGAAWRERAHNEAGASRAQPHLPNPVDAALVWSSSDPGQARAHLSRDGLVAAQCRPRNVSGAGTAQAALDYIEIAIWYRTE